MKNGVVLVLLIVVLACGGMALWTTQQMALTTQSNTARIEQARAEQLNAIALQEQAAARRAEAEKEQALYDAAGYAITTQSDLVDYYARRGDVRANNVWQWLVGIAVVLFIVKISNQNNNITQNVSPACLPKEAGVLLEAPERENTYLPIQAGK
jgi:uncharacterized protein HemX